MLTPECDLAHCTPDKARKYRWLHSSDKYTFCALWKSGLYLGNMHSERNHDKVGPAVVNAECVAAPFLLLKAF
jgi:hypothetical protein